MPDIFIKPTEITNNIVKIDISVSRMELERTCEFMIDVYSDKGTIIKRTYYTLSQEQYDNWGDDDNYVYDLILENLGYERQ